VGVRSFITAMLLAAATGCATRSEQVSDPERQEYATKVTFSGGRAEGLLQEGRQAITEGRFDAGLATLVSVHGMPDAKEETREQALLSIAHAYANVLNPKRDVDRARATYEQFLVEFPNSKQRVQVEEALRGLPAPPKD
jgi:hypothetical protein